MLSKKIIIPTLLSIFTLTTPISSVFSQTRVAYDPIRRNKYELQNTNNELREKKAIVESLKKKESQTSFQLIVLQKQLENTSMKLEDAKYRYQKTQQQIKETDSKLKKANSELNTQVKNTLETIKRLHKYKYVDFLIFLFDSQDVSTFMRRLVYFNYILKQDNEQIAKIKKKKQEVQLLKSAYQEKKIQIASISQNISYQKSIYEDQAAETEDYLQKVKNQREVYEREVTALEQESNRIAAVLRRLIDQQRRAMELARRNKNRKYQTFTYGRNTRLGWPSSSSNLTSSFGYRVHPIFRSRRLHSGIDIGAPSGTPIYAAAGGQVIESGWLGGYGKCIIIDHGDGVATLYGHASTLYVSSGQTVNKGALIGAIGSTGFSTGPHLHFEVRINGSPVNPLAYLR